jgi:D-serine deaminase-like pyridoxal phosphate-dependent protein
VTLSTGTQGTLTVTAVAAADTGAVGTATNQENAIVMTAFLTGGSATTVDIIKQVSTRRYKVTDGTRTGILTLKSSVATAAGECSIKATDASAGTYFVTKLTKNTATLTRGTGTVYTDGAQTPWTFGAATATVCQIENA